MKVAIYGAGAIGGHIGALLARSGVDVTLIARGAHLAAIKADGLRLLTAGEEIVVRPACTDDPAEAGPQDYIILTLKAPSVPGITERLAPMLSAETTVVTAMNGIPFWYFYKAGGPWDGHRLESVDPGGRQWDAIGPERCVGCIVWTAGEIAAPGVVRHSYGNRMPLGEPDGSRSQRIVRLSKAMGAAGLKAPEPLIERDLAEQDFGDWQGLAWDELRAAGKPDYDAFWEDPGNNPPPGGESLAQVIARVSAVIERLTAEHAGRDIVAVTHGGTIRSALALAFDLEPVRAIGFLVDNLSLTRIDHFSEGILAGRGTAWRVVTVNSLGR